MRARYVSLLRGINVGGHHLVPMARLRAIYEDLGCEDVSSHLQSGNVLFRRDRPSAVAARRSDWMTSVRGGPTTKNG
jgi:uncharacterized protein (DUF1697 family)